MTVEQLRSDLAECEEDLAQVTEMIATLECDDIPDDEQDEELGELRDELAFINSQIRTIHEQFADEVAAPAETSSPAAEVPRADEAPEQAAPAPGAEACSSEEPQSSLEFSIPEEEDGVSIDESLPEPETEEQSAEGGGGDGEQGIINGLNIGGQTLDLGRLPDGGYHASITNNNVIVDVNAFAPDKVVQLNRLKVPIRDFEMDLNFDEGQYSAGYSGVEIGVDTTTLQDGVLFTLSLELADLFGISDAIESAIEGSDVEVEVSCQFSFALARRGEGASVQYSMHSASATASASASRSFEIWGVEVLSAEARVGAGISSSSGGGRSGATVAGAGGGLTFSLFGHSIIDESGETRAEASGGASVSSWQEVHFWAMNYFHQELNLFELDSDQRPIINQERARSHGWNTPALVNGAFAQTCRQLVARYNDVHEQELDPSHPAATPALVDVAGARSSGTWFVADNMFRLRLAGMREGWPQSPADADTSRDEQVERAGGTVDEAISGEE